MSASPVLNFPGSVQLQRVIREQLNPHFVECEVWAYADCVAPFHCCRAFIKEDGIPQVQARHAVMSLAETEAVESALQFAREWIREQLGLPATMHAFARLQDETEKPTPNHRYGGEEV